MRTFWNSPVLLSLACALFYSVATPILRFAGLAGASGFAFCIGFGLPLVIYGGIDMERLVPSPRPFTIALIAGVLLATGFRFSVRAFSLETGHTSLVAVLTATYPALSIILAIFFLGEAHKVRLGWMSLGATLVLVGVAVIVTLGQKNP